MCSDAPDYSSVANSNAEAARLAKQTADKEQAFREKVYQENKPLVANAVSEATATSAQSRQLAQQAADRASQQWEQYQRQYAPIESQVGLDALGAQYLSAEDRAQLENLMQKYPDGYNKFTYDAQGFPQYGITDKQRTQLITELQRKAEQNAVNEELANAGKIRSEFDTRGGQIEALGNQQADREVSDAAGLTSELNARGDSRRADATGFYNKQAADLLAKAEQRAAADESKALTRANASVSNTYGQRARDMARYGMNPNKFGDLATQEANSQALARVAAGSQVGDTISRNLREADTQATGLRVQGEELGRGYQYADQDAGFGLKSKALENARAIRSGAQTSALNTRFAGRDQAMNIENTAKERVNSKFATMRSGAANFGRGYANTNAGQTSLALQGSGQAAQAAGQAANANLPSAQFAAAGYTPYYNVAQLQQQGGLGLGALKAQGGGGGFDFGGLGSLLGGAASAYSAFAASDKKVKTSFRKMSDNEILDGLEAAKPNQSWRYKEGTPGVNTKRRNVGPMAQDMQREFPDVSNGRQIDVAGDMGLLHAGLVALNRKVDRIAKED